MIKSHDGARSAERRGGAEEGPGARAIGHLVSTFEVSHRTLRFYEEKGLLKPRRDARGQRAYTAAEFQRIEFILSCRRIGLSVEDIAVVLAEADRDPADTSVLVRAIAKRRAILAEQLGHADEWLRKIGEDRGA